AKSLMEAIEKRFGGNKETKKVQKTLLKQHTNELVSVVTSVSAASTKVPISALPNVDTLSDEEMDLKWQMAMLTTRERRFLQRTGRNLRANGTTSIGFDMSKVEFYNCHRRGHFARECSVMVLEAMIGAFRKSQFDVLSYKTGLESVEARILVYQQNETVFEEDIKLLKVDVMLRDNALVDLKKKFKNAEQERDELKLKLEKFQTSSKNLSQLLASQTFDKTGLGYDNQMFNSTVFDCDEMFSSKFDVSMPTSPVYDRPSVKPVEHPIPAENLRKDIPKSRGHRHSWNRKTCFVCKSLTHLIKDCDYYEKKMTKVQHQRPTKHSVTKAYSPKNAH
nr:ribonuclease H-like domain-containing protein [Tanacetum cinerariifolium]